MYVCKYSQNVNNLVNTLHHVKSAIPQYDEIFTLHIVYAELINFINFNYLKI